jgi:cytidyltransferase-like protein
MTSPFDRYFASLPNASIRLTGHFDRRRPTTVYTGGTFDLFHAGHAALLGQCRKLAGPGGRVTVSLNTDAFVASYKGRPPILTYREREAVLRACRHVDEVVQNRAGADSRPAIEEVRPDIIAIGTDWATRDYHRQMGFTQDWLDQRAITLVYVAHAYSASLSTSDIRARLEER